MFSALFARPAVAESLRIATFNTELSRKGPGLLLRDIRKGDTQANAVAAVIAQTAPDVIVLNGVDYDHNGLTLAALTQLIAKAGHDMPYRFAARPNSGWATELDLDGDGRLGGAGDAHGWGRFAGAGGMAILSRYPMGKAHDLSQLIWAEQAWATLPQKNGKPFPSEAALKVQRLSSVGHWIVPIKIDERRALSLMAFHATPPVFDGPEDRNGKRNHDEISLWRHVLDGGYGVAPDKRFVILGDANLDPVDGQGLKSAIGALLTDPRVQDVQPQSAGAKAQGDPWHLGDPALDTVDWPGREKDAKRKGPGNLRVDYVLPSIDLKVTGAGVFWPAPGQSGEELARRASRHRLVWVDVSW